MYGTLVGVYAPAIALGVYVVGAFVLGQKEIYDKKFAFIHEYSLGYVFLAHYIVYLTRLYAAINCNGARSPARLDRPDQHIYRIMAKQGELSSAPYVLMANTGAAGRFNRATRAAANMDESITTLNLPQLEEH